MKFERVRTFVTIADAGSFLGAARRLGLGQPAVSKRMARLEQELGARLFTREASGVRLTAAGESFLAEARKIVELNDRAVARARAATDGGGGVLHLAYEELLRSHELLLGAIAVVFADTAPGAEIVSRRLAAVDQWRALEARDLHVGVGYGEPPAVSRLAWQRLADTTASGALLPADHPLAHAPSLRFRDLTGFPLLLFARELNPPLHDHVLTALAERGLRPTLRTTLHSHSAREAAVRAGLGWMLGVDGLPEAAEGVIARKVDEAPIATTFSLWWRADATEQLVLSFVEIARATG